MDLRHLRYFIAVAENLSFTRAAERLHIAQPPLSLQIRQLEEELGVTLLHRTRRIVELSDAGRIFLEQARQIIRATQSAVVQAQRAQRGEIGQLAVGFFEHMSYTLLPPVLSAYRERFPSVDVKLRWFPVIGQADALARGDVDISFMRAVPGIEEVQRQTILTDKLMLALPATHPFAARNKIALRTCADERFIMYVPNLAPDFHNMIIGMCANAGFMPQIALEVGQVYTALGLVSSGAGLAFVPTSVKGVKFNGVIYKPITGRTPKIEVMLGWRQRIPSPLLMAFVETAKLVAQAAHPT
ncbi:MAG: LysR family transcriptional regulator [Burkholderiales bacterium]|nr:LysR family transcriptional regulator [Burkholderiales bacterium]